MGDGSTTCARHRNVGLVVHVGVEFDETRQSFLAGASPTDG